MRKHIVLALSFFAAFASVEAARAERVELRISTIAQQTEVWCWAATISMVMQLYGYPNTNPAGNYQCGVVGVVFPECDGDCRQCIRAIGPMPNMVRAFRRYQDYIEDRYNFRFPVLDPEYKENPRFEQIRASLRANFPVVVGISPAGRPRNPENSQHAILVSGFEETRTPNGVQRTVILNDPLLYGPGQNPYQRLGGWVHPPSGKAVLSWEAFQLLNPTAAIFFVD